MHVCIVLMSGWLVLVIGLVGERSILSAPTPTKHTDVTWKTAPTPFTDKTGPLPCGVELHHVDDLPHPLTSLPHTDIHTYDRTHTLSLVPRGVELHHVHDLPHRRRLPGGGAQAQGFFVHGGADEGADLRGG